MINGKDYIYSAVDEFAENSGETVNFALKKDGAVVLTGVARQFPDGRPIRFYLNRLAEPYLDTLSWNDIFIDYEFWDYVGMMTNTEAGGYFQIVDTDTDTEICSSYVIKGFGTQSGVTNCPIDTHADPRQRIFFCGASPSGFTSEIDAQDKNSGDTPVAYYFNFITPDYVLVGNEVTAYTVTWYTNYPSIRYTTDGVTFKSTVSSGATITFPANTSSATTVSHYFSAYNSNGDLLGTVYWTQNTAEGEYSNEYLYFDILNNDDNLYWYGFISSSAVTIQYSKDSGSTWSSVTASNNTGVKIPVSQGDRVYLKGNNDTYRKGTSPNLSWHHFSGTTQIDIGGNIMSMIYGDDFIGKNSFPAGYDMNFYGMFENMNVVSAEKLSLPATSLTPHCYSDMFSGCGMLTSVPRVLKATSLATSCYSHMFASCSSLAYAPALPSGTLANSCYLNMFYGCSSITQGPELPALEVPESAYAGMFNNCSSLTTPPIIRATVLNFNSCYGMFSRCTSLVNTPVLRMSVLGEFSCLDMFDRCTSLTGVTMPPATVMKEGCYAGMFCRCTSLVTAPSLPSTSLDVQCYENMFSGCTALVNAPALPASTLYEHCYDEMFEGCTSLVTAPVLPAVTLAEYCYYRMFRGCTSLSYVKCLAMDNSAQLCTSGWVNGVNATGTFVKASGMNSWTTGIDGIPSGWTVVDAV